MSKKDKLLLGVISGLTVVVIALIIVLICLLNKDDSEVASVSANSSSQSESDSQKGDNQSQNKENPQKDSFDNSIVNFDPDSDNKPDIDNSLPPNVEIKPQKDPENGENKGIIFPYEIKEYNLVIEKLADYDGIYVEDGTNSEVKGVAALLVRNDGEYPIEYTEISINYGTESLQFNVSALGKGEKAVVQEKSRKAVPKTPALSGNALVVRRADMGMSENTVSITDNGDNSITITNLTDKTIPAVRVFYKYYMRDEELFVGGIAFSSRIVRLAANSKTVIRPAHYNSDTAKIVMVTCEP